MGKCASAREALDYVERHGVVLASARGGAPRLTEAIIGEPIKGSWWTHAQNREIYTVLKAVSESETILVVWVPPDVEEQAKTTDEREALAVFGAWVQPLQGEKP